MAFRFRLEPVLQHRRRTAQEAERRLADHERQRRIRIDRFAPLRAGERRARGEFLEAQASGAAGEAVAAHREYLLALAQRLRTLAERLEADRLEVGRLRDELVRRHRDRRVVERLRERRAGAYEAEQMRKAQLALDEVAAVRAHKRLSAVSDQPSAETGGARTGAALADR